MIEMGVYRLISIAPGRDKLQLACKGSHQLAAEVFRMMVFVTGWIR